MKDRILLISRRGEECLDIMKNLRDEGLFDVELATTAPESISRITRSKIDLLIMNLDSFTIKKIQLAQNLRHLDRTLPVLILASSVAPKVYEIVMDMQSTVLLEKPFEVKDLNGLSEKLIHGRSVKQRIFRRYYTNEKAELELFRGGQSIESKIRNLSRGGAFIEYKGQPDIKVGEMLRLNIELSQISRHYEVNAKVIWSTRVSPWGEDPGVGVEFLKSREIYQNLLRKM